MKPLKQNDSTAQALPEHQLISYLILLRVNLFSLGCNTGFFHNAASPTRRLRPHTRPGSLGLQLCYKFDECQGTIGYHSSGNSYNMTITAGSSGNNDSAGTCSSGAADPTNEMWNAGTTGKFNVSLDFDATDGYASTSGTIINASSQQTYTTVSWGEWFYPTTGVATETLMEKNREFRLTTSSSKPNCSIWTAGAFSTAAVSSVALFDNWFLAACPLYL